MTISNVQVECVPISKHHGTSYLHYDRTDPDGSITHIKKLLCARFDAPREGNTHRFVLVRQDRVTFVLQKVLNHSIVAQHLVKAPNPKQPQVNVPQLVRKLAVTEAEVASLKSQLAVLNQQLAAEITAGQKRMAEISRLSGEISRISGILSNLGIN